MPKDSCSTCGNDGPRAALLFRLQKSDNAHIAPGPARRRIGNGIKSSVDERETSSTCSPLWRSPCSDRCRERTRTDEERLARIASSSGCSTCWRRPCFSRAAHSQPPPGSCSAPVVEIARSSGPRWSPSPGSDVSAPSPLSARQLQLWCPSLEPRSAGPRHPRASSRPQSPAAAAPTSRLGLLPWLSGRTSDPSHAPLLGLGWVVEPRRTLQCASRSSCRGMTLL